MPRWSFRDPEGSFWSKLDRSCGPEACWEWLGAIDPGGYGALKVGGKKVGAHRYALELSLGRPIGKGLLACHTCHNRACCNPAHLYEGTYQQNVLDAVAAGTHSSGGSKPGDHQGVANGNAIIDEQIALDIYQRACAGESYTQIVKDYSDRGVTRNMIKDIKNGRAWAWLTGAKSSRKRGPVAQ